MGFLKPNIGKMKANGDVEGLIEALEHRDWRIRWDAAVALWEIGDARAVEPLIQAMKDVYFVESNFQDEKRIRIAGVDPYLAYVGQGIVCIGWIALPALVKIGEPAVGPLIQALGDEIEFVRVLAARALGEIGDARAVEPLTKSLKDKERDVRGAAKEALERLKGREKRSSKLNSKRKTTPRQGKTVSELVDEGASLGTRGEHEAALRCFNKTLQLNPRYALAWFNKGATLERLDRYEEALWCLNKALEIDPGLPRPPLRWRCPKCGSILEDDEFNRGWAAYSGTVTCSACGKQCPAGDVHSGKYDIMPRKPKD